MTFPRTSRRLARLLLTAAVATALAATGCSSNPRKDTMDLAAELATRDSLEDAVARYERMLATIRQRLDDEFGPHAWYTAYEETLSSCGGEFADVLDGRTASLTPWGFPAAVSAEDWPRVLAVIDPILTEHGFATGGVGIDEPGKHLLHAFDSRLGAHFRLGSVVHTSIGVTTGCHLPAAARATVAPGPAGG